jgi:hypothetical protein
MNTLRTLTLLTAFGVISSSAAEALAEEPGAPPHGAPDVASPGAQSTPPPPNVGDNERAAGKEKQIAGDTKPKDKLVGLPVETPAGDQLGSVVDIVRNKGGEPTYAVVAMDTDTAAVPYDTALGMVRNQKVVMPQAKLAKAPKVKQSEWLDQTHSDWRTQADRYWGNTRTASREESKKPAQR